MDKSYRELFFGESQEYLGEINKYLVVLERNPGDSAALDEIFRLVHTLKGMAATMGFDHLADLAHNLEDVFDDLRSGRRQINSQIVDVVFSSVDAFGILLDELHKNKQPSIQVADYIVRLKASVKPTRQSKKEGKVTSDKSTVPFDFSAAQRSLLESKKIQGFDIIEIEIHISPDCLMKEARVFLIIVRLQQLGEVITMAPPEEALKQGEFDQSFRALIATQEDIKIINEELHRVLEIEKVHIRQWQDISPGAPEPKKPSVPAYLKKIQSMRIPVNRLDKVMNLMGELSIAKSRLMRVVDNNDAAGLPEAVFAIDRLATSLQDEILQMRLLPISYILDTFPRIVRDAMKKTGKEVDLQITGSDIELDRVILDEIGDPLVHLVRNAIDHGIEDVETRKKIKKSPKGKLAIKVAREKGYVTIEISDDGGGINIKSVGEAAVRKGLFPQDKLAGIDVKQALDILTLPGFSMSSRVTDLSGRGVGLDAVRTKLDSLGGRLDLETSSGEGTRFILTLPLTLAIIKAMLVEVGREIFAIPLMNIRESIKINPQEIKTIQEKEVITVRDEIIPLIRLDQELAIAGQGVQTAARPVVITETRLKSIGFLVDRIIGEQDIVVKPLGFMVEKIRGVAGATILGDGRVALILDVVNLR